MQHKYIYENINSSRDIIDDAFLRNNYLIRSRYTKRFKAI